MTLTCENLLPRSCLQPQADPFFSRLQSVDFLSFQDALHYLVRAYDLAGRKILLPAFYCDATLHDMAKHGLTIVLCPVDQVLFDIDREAFEQLLKTETPDIILIYNFFGKNSRLYIDTTWRQHISPEAIIISDFAHCLLPNHDINFLAERHFYVDSTRKTTSFIMAHLVHPPGFVFRPELAVRLSAFRFAMRALFFLKTACLKVATRTAFDFLAALGMHFFVLHDRFIGSPKAAHRGFRWDGLRFRHIDFAKVRQHRAALYGEYAENFSGLAAAGHIELFELPAAERVNLCYFFLRIVEERRIAELISYLETNGYWVDRLWDFDKVDGMEESERQWAKSIIVFPYTLQTRPAHIRAMAALTRTFFNHDR